MSGRRVVQMLVALVVAAGAFLFAWNSGDSAEPVLPEVQSQFSLDLRVIDSAPLDMVYLVEQRSRPAYRIFRFDPRSGEELTLFTVPEDAIIYGIALSPDKGSLAVSYTTEHAIDGNGMWILDLETLELTEALAAETGLYLTEPEFSADGESVFVTHVDRRGDAEVLSLGEVNLASGSLDVVLPNAITPAVDGDNLYFLTVDSEKARRSIGVRAADGSTSEIEVGDTTLDLDHLVASEGSLTEAAMHVAVLETIDEPTVTIGDEAGAHGNHSVKSTWWGFDSVAAVATSIDPIIVYDASATDDGTIVYATLEGLSIAAGERIDLIKSRALRFIAS